MTNDQELMAALLIGLGEPAKIQSRHVESHNWMVLPEKDRQKFD